MPPPHVTSTCSRRGPVPQQREQAADRVDLEVTEVGRDLDVLHRERLEQLERRARRGRVVGHGIERSRAQIIDFSSGCVSSRSSRPPNIDATNSVAPASASRSSSFVTVGLVADDRDVGRPGGALAVEHGPVRRQEPVDLEDLRGTLAGGVGVVGHADRAARRPMRGAGSPARCGGGGDRRDGVATRVLPARSSR